MILETPNRDKKKIVKQPIKLEGIHVTKHQAPNDHHEHHGGINYYPNQSQKDL